MARRALAFAAALHETRAAMERILAHPDDEASCVGALAKHAGDAVRLLWLSRGGWVAYLRENGKATTLEHKKSRRAGGLASVLARELFNPRPRQCSGMQRSLRLIDAEWEGKNA